MPEPLEKRACELAVYMIETGATVRAARKLLPPEEYQALAARLAQGPLTREEYRMVYRQVKAQRDALANQ